MKIISIKDNTGIPKYKQIVQSVEKSIENGQLQKDDKLPSINKICNKFSLSRDTVFTAFNDLRTRGIIYSIPGKGNYIKSIEIGYQHRIFLLFDELNSFKENLYNSLLSELGENAQVEIYFHHFNINMFEKLIHDSIGNYTCYIIMPANLKNVRPILNVLPQESVYILDQTNKDLSIFPAIYQNFRKDIYQGLVQGTKLLSKYDKLILVYPGVKQPLGMLLGFEDFCNDHTFENEVIEHFGDREVKKGEVYVIPNDRTLVNIIKKTKEQHLHIGTEIGIISYNDTFLKEVVENGVTTISTDFFDMGEKLAQMVLNGDKLQIENNSSLIIRNTL